MVVIIFLAYESKKFYFQICLSILAQEKDALQIGIDKCKKSDYQGTIYNLDKVIKSNTTNAEAEGLSEKGHKAPTSYRIYRLITEVLDKFENIAIQDIATNNLCERQNGLILKNRSKTMRGFEVPGNVTKFTDFTRWVRGQEIADLAMVV